MNPSGTRDRGAQGDSPEAGGSPLLDLTVRSDADLHHLRIRQTVAIPCWATVGLAGLVGAVRLESRPFLEVIALSAIVAGVIWVSLCTGGLIRVLREQRDRVEGRRLLAARPERSPWGD